MAKVRCTIYGEESQKELKAIDNGWTLFNDDAALRKFLYKDAIKLFHQGPSQKIHHICAKYSTWGFDAGDGHGAHSVVFLRYSLENLKIVAIQLELKPNEFRFPPDDVFKKPGIFPIRGCDVYKTYRKLRDNKHTPVHVWHRPTHKEIAVDFCVS